MVLMARSHLDASPAMSARLMQIILRLRKADHIEYALSETLLCCRAACGATKPSSSNKAFQISISSVSSSRKNFSHHGLEIIERSRRVIGVEGCLIPSFAEMHALIVERMIFVLISSVTITSYMMGVVVGLK